MTSTGTEVTFIDYRGTLRAGTVVSVDDELMATVLDLASGENFGLDLVEDEYAVVS